ncbi:glutathione S-transferase family protein [Halioxenophilus sp. WMMB6]|uniref:glutathione S-transferase family protein n=1 Tax=Halioxenophilus sp. WMMB6 TaxID=3073815 RepID=UPI00295F49C5|nr:glutathione S-transferase family protein [Halioxenophilus sp. WMMB6]
MGLLINGVWWDQWYDTDASGGSFEREQSKFRNWVTASGKPGPTGLGGFAAEPGRYHLYVSLACPWANRALIFRQLKGLSNLIGVSVVHPEMLTQGWTFEQQGASQGDRLYNSDFLHQIYTRARSDYTGRVTVPILWDRQRQTIVSNESADIIRMFNSAFDHLTGNKLDFYPQRLRDEIDRVNRWIYDDVNNGVYRAGFATSQQAYEEAFDRLFAALDELERLLGESPYLVGGQITEADWRLFTTLVRFDAVYFGHFKCNYQQIADYPALSRYVRELYHYPGVAETIDIEQIKQHYYASHKQINPTGVVPRGPKLSFL